ncbi:MAG: DHH family phosphoesterase [Candidatus Micrarchaeota archaeon]
MNRDESGFLERCGEVRGLALSFKEPLIVHHYDADGISSGAIVAGAFLDEGRAFRRECIKKLDDEAIDRYSREPETIFVDLGGGNKRVNELKDALIIDHHQTEGIEKPQANPVLFGLDGGGELSAAGTAYCVFRKRPDLAVVGAVGDMQHPLIGMNRWVLAEGQKSGEVLIEEDLAFYGRYCRPLVQFLAFCDDPYIPGISYREDKAQELLSELGIPLEKTEPETGDRKPGMRVYADLDDDEKRKLVSALAKVLIAGNRMRSLNELIGESYVFPKRPRDETFEANEFSTLLNACGRHSQPEIGVRVCLGDIGAQEEARKLLALHRRSLREGIGFASTHVQDFGAFYFLDGRGLIDEGIVGVVCGMALQQSWTKPIIGAAYGENDTVKISGRSPKALIEKGLNLGEMMKAACLDAGGIGGGHKVAAGASIPKDRINEFLVSAGEFVRGWRQSS